MSGKLKWLCLAIMGISLVGGGYCFCADDEEYETYAFEGGAGVVPPGGLPPGGLPPEVEGAEEGPSNAELHRALYQPGPRVLSPLEEELLGNPVEDHELLRFLRERADSADAVKRQLGMLPGGAGFSIEAMEEVSFRVEKHFYKLLYLLFAPDFFDNQEAFDASKKRQPSRWANDSLYSIIVDSFWGALLSKSFCIDKVAEPNEDGFYRWIGLRFGLSDAQRHIQLRGYFDTIDRRITFSVEGRFESLLVAEFGSYDDPVVPDFRIAPRSSGERILIPQSNWYQVGRHPFIFGDSGLTVKPPHLAREEEACVGFLQTDMRYCPDSPWFFSEDMAAGSHISEDRVEGTGYTAAELQSEVMKEWVREYINARPWLIVFGWYFNTGAGRVWPSMWVPIYPRSATGAPTDKPVLFYSLSCDNHHSYTVRNCLDPWAVRRQMRNAASLQMREKVDLMINAVSISEIDGGAHGEAPNPFVSALRGRSVVPFYYEERFPIVNLRPDIIPLPAGVEGGAGGGGRGRGRGGAGYRGQGRGRGRRPVVLRGDVGERGVVDYGGMIVAGGYVPEGARYAGRGFRGRGGRWRGARRK